MVEKLHAQQQEFQTVYECIDKITQFMSRATIFSLFCSNTNPNLLKALHAREVDITGIDFEMSEKWIREHRQEYRGNRTVDLQDAYITPY